MLTDGEKSIGLVIWLSSMVCSAGAGLHYGGVAGLLIGTGLALPVGLIVAATFLAVAEWLCSR